jgi:hypothetical protein
MEEGKEEVVRLGEQYHLIAAFVPASLQPLILSLTSLLGMGLSLTGQMGLSYLLVLDSSSLHTYRLKQ